MIRGGHSILSVKIAIMKKYFTLLVFAAFAVACGGADEAGKNAGQSTASTQSTAPAVAEIDAKKIWKIRCVACHGLYGNQGLNGAANLQEVSISLAERINIITNGRQGEQGVMTAFGEILSEAEIKAVAEYTMTFNKDL